MTTDPRLFFIIFSAVFGGVVLAGVFFWGAIVYSRMERDGRHNSRDGFMWFLAMMAPLVFAAMSMMIAFDKVPAWLDRALQ
jgi:ABC-type uncharacterized transport system permease subunit